MNEPKIERLLTNHKLRKTDIRKDVLEVFLTNDKALTNQDIEENLQDNADRITLYRTLNKFVEHGILHRIENANQTHYALCHGCNIHHHSDNHIHFKCTSCESIECFDQPESLGFSLPPNYAIKKVNILVEGICAKCK